MSTTYGYTKQVESNQQGSKHTRAISPKKGTYVRRLTKPASLVHEHMFIDHRTYVHRPSNICSPKSLLFGSLDVGRNHVIVELNDRSEMNTEHGYRKQVESHHQGSKHTLASLMSKLRSSLGAAWEQPRSSLEYAYSMLMTTFLRPFSSKRAELERRLASDEITARPSRDYVSSLTRLRLVVSMLLFLVLGNGGVWGQETPDYSGTYYIRSESTNKNTPGDYYLCPTKNWYLYKATNSYEDDTDDNDDNGQPFLTTYQCKDGVYDASKAVWDVVKHPTKTDCYYIIQRKTGRYMVSNGQIGSDANRMRVHLEAVADATALANLGDLALFEITSHGTHFDIVPHSSEGRNGDYIYLVVNFKNFNELKGSDGKKGGPNGTYGTNTAGIIGLYNQEENHKWFLESAKCTTPVITFSNTTSTITITAGDGESIYYTTDESNPDANSYVYTAPFELTEGMVIKAISKKTNLIDSEIATLTVVKLATPVITFNEETRKVTITAAEGAMIYYTTNDTDPTIGETTAHGASPVVIAHALPSTKIHARAVKSGSFNSDVATKTDIPVKVLTNPTIILAEDEFVYDGSAKEPAITVKDGDVIISADEYVVTYSNNTNAGTASVTISDNADGDYQVNDGSKSFTISPKSLGDGTTAAGGITVEMTDDGSLSAVKDGSTTLVENTDYTQETVEEGSDKIITITGKGNYTGIVKGIYASPVFVDSDGGGSGQAAAVYQAKRDLSCPSGIKPYIIRKVNPSIGTAVITKLDYIPEDVPVLLLSDAEASGFVASPKDPSTPDVTAQTKNSNLLKVSSGGETVGAAQIYMFYQGEFVLTKAGTLGEGKYFLYNPNYNAQAQTAGGNSGSASSRGSLQIVFDDETTGISEMNNSKIEEKETDVWYTLEGQRIIGKPSKGGIYIRKGQKIFLKRN